MRTRSSIGLLTVLALAACGSVDRSASPGDQAPPPAVVCEAREGSVTDVANEPDWRPYAEYRRWTTVDGCLLRIDVIADRPGADHCGWGAARVIITGIPVGAPYSSLRDSAHYVRDPDDVFGDPATAGAFYPDTVLPDGAVDTGYREGGSALWVDPDDGSAIYLVTADTVERWPLDPEQPGCD